MMFQIQEHFEAFRPRHVIAHITLEFDTDADRDSVIGALGRACGKALAEIQQDFDERSTSGE